jgi:hypothetical protein
MNVAVLLPANITTRLSRNPCANDLSEIASSRSHPNTIPPLMSTKFSACLYRSFIFVPRRVGRELFAWESSRINDGERWRVEMHLDAVVDIYIYIFDLVFWMFGRHWIIQYTQPRSSNFASTQMYPSPRSDSSDGCGTISRPRGLKSISWPTLHSSSDSSPKRLMTSSQKDRSVLKRQNVLFGMRRSTMVSPRVRVQCKQPLHLHCAR